MTSFKDHFSKHALNYAKYRPKYKEEFFAYLSSLTKGHELCWDVGTGNGQAAVSLSKHFQKVIATDPSAPQIEQAQKESNIEYYVEPAEVGDSIKDGSVDLITVAQALHWFDFDKFYQRVNRVLKPEGLICAWTYELVQSEKQEITDLVVAYDQFIYSYWPPERDFIRDKYSTIPWPFPPVLKDQPAVLRGYDPEYEWSVEDMFNYLYTWSSSQKYINTHQKDPLESFKPRFKEHWGDGKLKVIFPQYYLLGKRQ